MSLKLNAKELLNKKLDVISIYLLGISAVVFLIFLIVQSIYIRPAYDDLYFISLVKNNGILGSLQERYFNWSGRWTGFIYYFTLIKLSNGFKYIHYLFALYYLLTISIFIYSVFSIVSFICRKYFKSKINFSVILIYSILFIASFYFFTFQNIEVWGWICGSIFYLQGIVLLLLGLALLLKENKRYYHYILLSLCFIYVGGSNEIYTLIICFSFLFYGIYFIYKNEFNFKNFKQKKALKGIIIACVSVIISSSISFSAPGNLVRKGKVTTTIGTENKSADTFPIKTFITQQKNYAALVLSFLWLFLGIKLKTNTINFNNKIVLWRIIIASLMLIVCSFFVISLFKFLFLNDQIIPLRTYTFTSFTLAAFCCILFFTVGFNISSKQRLLISYTQLFISFTVCTFLSLHLFKQYVYASNYANRYDQMISLLTKEYENKRKETLYINNLPDAGTLLGADLENKDLTMNPLKEILNLTFEIKVIK